MPSDSTSSSKTKKSKTKPTADFVIDNEEKKILIPRNYWIEFYDEEEQRWICKFLYFFLNLDQIVNLKH